ncbi:transcription factor HIVEP3 [Salarias fasciatus]|uniref:transcription factor HIVEP3 n=1 Tax=Salarias fasciatus TaxID=181472 RepID=UPI00117691B2|nr:transcription factor HIVEP3-like [Salarias fasciatus]
MEALHSRLTTGEPSGGQEHCQPESPQRGPQLKSPSQPRQEQQTGSTKPHGTSQQPKQSRRQNPERKRLRHQRQSVDSDTPPEQKQEVADATTAPSVSGSSPGVPSTSAGGSAPSKSETQEGTPKQKRERKPQRPGKYVCSYCGRACAKPSVLQKHIRSHTGERPYPCAPCGFSFKTKSNLYKHRKSHTHRVKAGLALGEPKSLEEQVTESEDETRQLSSASSLTERQGSVPSIKSNETDRAKDCTEGSSDSYAVKKRLALRLSRGKHALQDSDDKTSSLILGSRGSTESGYFSLSESTEQSQDSPPNTSAKSYAEIILGKYGRLGHLQRMPRQQNQHPTGQEDKNLSFTVPKKQVIEHITKLITINEAVVDTSKIDSVKPRRFSLSRKNSSESQKTASIKEPLIQSPKAGDLGYKNSGSITMGVPCEKFHHASMNVEHPASQTSSAPLLRSQSVPSAASSFDSSNKFRQSQSFDERPPSETQPPRRYGMLRRQPAIEIPLGSEFTKEEHESSHSFYPDSTTTVPDHKQNQPQPYECEACGIGCKDWEGYKKHKQSSCPAHHPRNEEVISQMECPQLASNAVRARALTMRKRRKEESFEFDDPSSPSLPSPALLSGQSKEDSSAAYESPRRPALQTCSVIQHTSSFEKQESLCSENQGAEVVKCSSPPEDFQQVPQNRPQQKSTKPTARNLVRQCSVQVPEILVTEDPNMGAETSVEPAVTAKPSEKPDEFQWPQRSPSLAQLPIEKLPPKKKRLRLAEAAQSSGDSSFDSISLPRSPSQDSSTSFASSRSTSFEEPNRPDMDTSASTPLRRSRAPHMLTVPGVHQHREMRRSASEQAPHEPQPSVLMSETRSKSFDYSCLSPERSAVGWRERRKCLLFKHSAVVDPDEEEEQQQCTTSRRSPEHLSPSQTSQETPPSGYYSGSSSSPQTSDTVLRNPGGSQCKEIFSQWKLSQNIQLTGSKELPGTHDPSVAAKVEASQQTTPQAPQPYLSHGPSGAARARYLPMSTGLKLEIPPRHDDYLELRVSQSHIQHAGPHITSSLEIVRPATSPAVAVRLQTDTLTPACAIYTTLSQATSPIPQEAVDAVSHSMGVSTTDYRNRSNVSPDFQPVWSDEDLRTSGSGGNKRMLSPSNSIEFSPESQQQQKRVKEEEEKEVEFADKAAIDTCNQELKREIQSCLPAVCSPVSHAGPSFPSLLSSTCNSWCYLNYIKPNPSALDEQKPSVYSSWSTSGYDPNPPGLSSKTALSLLHCKQRLSPSIYTISAMSVRTAEEMEQEDNKRPRSTEVYDSRSPFRDHEGMEEKGRPTAHDNTSSQKEKKKEDSTPCDCNRCSSTFKATASLPAEHPGPETHGPEACRLPQDRHEGVPGDESVGPDRAEHQFSGPQRAGRPEQDAAKEPVGRRDEDSRGPAAVKGQEPSPQPPKESAPKMSASARRAMFARRRLDASASPAGSRSPSGRPPTPRREPPSPPRSPSPRRSPALPSPTCQTHPASPVRGVSPVAVRPPAADPSRPSSSAAETCFRRSSRPSVEDVVVTHVAPPPARPRGTHNLLSHLPLHSQQAGRAPSLLIPIGGIHMIQPRSPLPLYSLVTSPPPMAAAAAAVAAATANPPGAPPRRRDTLKETSPAGPDADTPPTERRLDPATSQGQKKSPPPQAQL